MAQYIIIKQFIIGAKTYYKDKILSESMPDNIIKRLETKGFIKSIVEASADYEETPFYEELDEFLTPKEVNKLKKAEMIGYARHIGAEVDPTLPNIAIASAINEFIAETLKDEEGTAHDEL